MRPVCRRCRYLPSPRRLDGRAGVTWLDAPPRSCQAFFLPSPCSHISHFCFPSIAIHCLVIRLWIKALLEPSASRQASSKHADSRFSLIVGRNHIVRKHESIRSSGCCHSQSCTFITKRGTDRNKFHGKYEANYKDKLHALDLSLTWDHKGQARYLLVCDEAVVNTAMTLVTIHVWRSIPWLFAQRHCHLLAGCLRTTASTMLR